MKEQWVVTVFWDYEPSEVYGTFPSEEEAIAWVDRQTETTQLDGYAFAVNRVRDLEEFKK